MIGERLGGTSKGQLVSPAVSSLSTAPSLLLLLGHSEQEQLVSAVTFETVFTLIAGPCEKVGLSVLSSVACCTVDDGRSLLRGVPLIPLKEAGVGVLLPPVAASRFSFLRL